MFVVQAAQYVLKVGEYIDNAPDITRIVEHVHPGSGEFLPHIHPAQYREGVFHQRGGTFGRLAFAGHIGECTGDFLIGDTQVVGPGNQVRHIPGEVGKFSRPDTLCREEGIQYFLRRGVLLAHDGKRLCQRSRYGVQVGKSRLAAFQGGVQYRKG